MFGPNEIEIANALKDVLPDVYKDVAHPTRGYNILIDHATDIVDIASLKFPQNENVYISNLVSLGLFVEKNEFLTEQSYYDDICKRIGVDELRSKYVPSKYKDLQISKGLYELTSFGQMFLKACVL